MTAAPERHFTMRFIGRKLPAAGEIGELIRWLPLGHQLKRSKCKSAFELRFFNFTLH
jgi:hypothetical protein